MAAVALGLGFSACSSDDVPGSQTDGGTTYMNLSFTFPTSVGTRATSTTGNSATDYNPKGTYVGNDEIKTIDVYVVNGLSVEFSKRYVPIDYEYANNTLTPKTAIKTTAGTKTVYVVINDPNALRSAPLNSQDILSIKDLATWTTDGKDLVTMTGYKTGSIEDGVNEVTAIAGTKNRINVDVTRLVSRAVVTASATQTGGEYTGTIGTLKDVTYSVAQGELSVYAYAKSDFASVRYGFVPNTDADYQAAAVGTTYYDYTGLSTKNPLDVVATAGAYSGVKGAYLFENTHLYAAAPAAGAVTYAGGYRKGNTAYVLVRGTFTPNDTVIADGGKLTNGTFYVGVADSKIYSTAAAAQAAVTGQQYRTYTNGKVLYYAWLNPDDITKPYNSPVVRNNVYHINITGFKTIGLNWNPLVPKDPSNPTINPDPKPTDENEPTDTPIRPTDPLTVNDTYMSVQVTVLPWAVHLYDIELGL